MIRTACSKVTPMRDRLKRSKELHLERMFETRSEAWERVGLNLSVNERAIRRARIEIALFVPLLIGVLVVYHHRADILGKSAAGDYSNWIQWGTVAALRSEERRVGKECRCRWSPEGERDKQGGVTPWMCVW